MQDNRRQLSAKVCIGSSSCFTMFGPFMSKEICATMDLSMGLQHDSLSLSLYLSISFMIKKVAVLNLSLL